MIRKLLKFNKHTLEMQAIEDLNQKLIYGSSTDDDLSSWERNLDLIKVNSNIQNYEYYYDQFENYLLIHFPNDKRILDKYIDFRSIDSARDQIYRDFLYKLLADALYLLKYIMKGYTSDKLLHSIFLIEKIESYISVDKKNKVSIKDTGIPIQQLNIELERMVYEMKSILSNPTPEFSKWHKTTANINAVKYMNNNSIDIFKRRLDLKKKHGCIVTGLNIQLIQDEVQLINSNTNDIAIIIDNSGSFEPFSKANNFQCIKLATYGSDFDIFSIDAPISSEMIGAKMNVINDYFKYFYKIGRENHFYNYERFMLNNSCINMYSSKMTPSFNELNKEFEKVERPPGIDIEKMRYLLKQILSLESNQRTKLDLNERIVIIDVSSVAPNLKSSEIIKIFEMIRLNKNSVNTWLYMYGFNKNEVYQDIEYNLFADIYEMMHRSNCTMTFSLSEDMLDIPRLPDYYTRVSIARNFNYNWLERVFPYEYKQIVLGYNSFEIAMMSNRIYKVIS